MLTCDACGGLTPRPDALVCIHCEAKLGKRRPEAELDDRASASAPMRESLRPRASLPGNWLAFVVGTAGTVLLAACYGPAGRYQGQTTPTPVDHDGDGSPANMDCNDNDPTIYPGAPDPEGDGIDQNCDGVDGWRDEKSKVAAPPDGGTGPDA